MNSQFYIICLFFIFAFNIFQVESQQKHRQLNKDCQVMAQYFERIGKPLSEKAISALDDSLCQRFSSVIRKHGVSTVDFKLRTLLTIRMKKQRYNDCMDTYNFSQYCKKFANGLVNFH